MENAINRKKTEISDLITEYKELVNLHSGKVSEYLKNEYYFKDMEENFNHMDDFEELKHFYYDLGVEFRQFVIKYNISHNLIEEKTIKTFLEKPFLHLLKEKPDEEPIDYSTDKTTIKNNEPINNSTINNEPINNSTINNETTSNNEEPMDNDLIMISNILKEPTMNNKQSLISVILNKSMISDIMNQLIDDDLKELLINNTLKHSMTCKILAQPINNKESLIKEPTINNILTHPMNNNL